MYKTHEEKIAKYYISKFRVGTRRKVFKAQKIRLGIIELNHLSALGVRFFKRVTSVLRF